MTLKIIYFLEDTGYSDAQLMIINYTLPINENNSYIKTLDGINYVSDIKFDTSSTITLTFFPLKIFGLIK